MAFVLILEREDVLRERAIQPIGLSIVVPFSSSNNTFCSLFESVPVSVERTIYRNASRPSLNI